MNRLFTVTVVGCILGLTCFGFSGCSEFVTSSQQTVSSVIDVVGDPADAPPDSMQQGDILGAALPSIENSELAADDTDHLADFDSNEGETVPGNVQSEQTVLGPGEAQVSKAASAPKAKPVQTTIRDVPKPQ